MKETVGVQPNSCTVALRIPQDSGTCPEILLICGVFGNSLEALFHQHSHPDIVLHLSYCVMHLDDISPCLGASAGPGVVCKAGGAEKNIYVHRDNEVCAYLWTDQEDFSICAKFSICLNICSTAFLYMWMNHRIIVLFGLEGTLKTI